MELSPLLLSPLQHQEGTAGTLDECPISSLTSRSGNGLQETVPVKRQQLLPAPEPGASLVIWVFSLSDPYTQGRVLWLQSGLPGETTGQQTQAPSCKCHRLRLDSISRWGQRHREGDNEQSLPKATCVHLHTWKRTHTHIYTCTNTAHRASSSSFLPSFLHLSLTYVFWIFWSPYKAASPGFITSLKVQTKGLVENGSQTTLLWAPSVTRT